ncbi:hypothetical protein SO802_023378 [Lithocarpus litseifolius]|uniref:Uncharacterized protein n=1 Tax=Lithocarpus litseifolius TaxID=425828 RepID=A0AAW2CBJ7_9ROSI
MILPGVGPSMVDNNTSNNRQQIISASPSQPSIPGYNNNQPVHPHMPFMPRQQMFGMGPRLPMSAIQQSPTSNVMFNSSGNVQPTLNQPMLRPVSGTSSSLGQKREHYMSSQFYDLIPFGDSFLHWKRKGQKKVKWISQEISLTFVYFLFEQQLDGADIVGLVIVYCQK